MLEFAALAQQCAPSVAPQTMAAIVKTESGFNPLAIGVNGSAHLERQPATKDEAVVTAKWLIANGYNIDMGLGQVNSANLARTGLTLEDAFDACRNLAASARILTGNYLAVRSKVSNDQRALYAAFSTYNTGSPTRGIANGYVQRVVANRHALDGLAAPGVPSVRPIPLTVISQPGQPGPPASAAALPSLLKAAPSRLVPQKDDESEIVKLMTDSPSDLTPRVGASRPPPTLSVYERDAQGIDVYR